MQVTSQGACGKLWQCWFWCSLLLYYSGCIGDAVKKQRTAWMQRGTGEPWCRVPVVALRDVQGQEPRGEPEFLHLSCCWFAGSRGQWGARNFRLLKLRSYFSPTADLQPPSAFPTGEAQEASLVNWGILHMCCCLWHVCKPCILPGLTARS